MTTRRLRVRTFVLLTALLPLSALTGLAAFSAERMWSDHQVSVGIAADARVMDALMEARVAVSDEQLASSVLLRAAEVGLDADALLALYGVDYRVEMTDARVRVDRSAIVDIDPVIADAFDIARALRPSLDDGTATADEAIAVYDGITKAIDARWLEALGRLHTHLADGAVPDLVDNRADAVRRMFETFTAGAARIDVADAIVTGGSSARLRELVTADMAYQAGLLAVRDRFGPSATVAFYSLRSASSTHRFDAMIERLIVDLLAGRTPDLADDVIEAGAALLDGAQWYVGLTDLVRAVSVDLGDAASAQATADGRALNTVLGLLSAVIVASLVAAFALARSITRPLRQMGAIVQAVHDGTFALPKMVPTGPRELAETALAVNEMAITLGAVEARALRLAEPLELDQVLPTLPGRTGAALQIALDRLQDLATRDGLTDLLNRKAAMSAIDREFARARRDGRMVMALFADLDGLKLINDTYSHRAGDDAIALVARVLGAVCREADIVARVGGDEFLVAGLVSGRAEADALVARIDEVLLTASVLVDDVAVPVRCSIGVAVTDPHTTTVEVLLDEADAAMYRTKARGRLVA